MSYRIMYKGLEVVCETPQEVDALASQKKVSPERFPRLTFQAQDVKGLVRSLKKNQQALLRHLLTGPQSDTELRAKIGLSGNKALAGVLTGIARNAKRFALESADLIARRISRNGTGERHYEYTLVPDAVEEVKGALRIKD